MPSAFLRATVVVLACVAGLATSASPASPRPDPDIFPGATFDAAESAALTLDGRAPRVFRTSHDFDIVVNYYRYKRKQGVNIVAEPLAAPFERIARALARGGSRALLQSRLVQDFHQHAFGARVVEAGRAVPAWQDFARRIAGPTQRIGEGNRITIYRPYVSRRNFAVVEDTVIILHSVGGGSR